MVLLFLSPLPVSRFPPRIVYLTVTKSRRLCLKHLRRLLFIHLKDAGMGNRQRESAILQPFEPVYQQKPGILPLPNTLYPALSPNRRRMLPQPPQNDLLRTWTEQNWCAHGLAQTKSIHPMYKSFAELFQKRPFPSFPVPRVPDKIISPRILRIR